ncbi:MAG TPA: glycosyltransferase family 2 protein [Gemmatimonadaceae bacterium]|nr:glycosyltransferase family 2 protein [Gemmatimonadaceae bacterium]
MSTSTRSVASCTVAIPVFNRRALVQSAVASALSQNVEGLDVLVVDNCSTDGTWEALQEFAHDPRVRLVRNERNVGLFGNFNRCLELSRGRYLRFLCSDDRLAEDCLQGEIAVMDAHPNVSLLSTRGRQVDSSGRVLGSLAGFLAAGVYAGVDAITEVLWFKAHYGYNPLNYPSGVLLRGDALARAGSFDMALRMSGDVEYFLRVLEHGDLAVLDSVGCDVLVHPGQEGSQLDGSVLVLEEEYALVDRFRTVLVSRGRYEQVRRQLSGICLGFAQKHWRRGERLTGSRQAAVARSRGATPLQMVTALARLVMMRVVLRTTGLQRRVARPIGTIA